MSCTLGVVSTGPFVMFTTWGGSVIGASPELEVPVLALVLVALSLVVVVLAPEPEVDAGSPPAPPDPPEVRVPVPEQAARIEAATNVKVRTGAFDSSMVGKLRGRPKRSAMAGEPNGRAAAIANGLAPSVNRGRSPLSLGGDPRYCSIVQRRPTPLELPFFPAKPAPAEAPPKLGGAETPPNPAPKLGGAETPPNPAPKLGGAETPPNPAPKLGGAETPPNPPMASRGADDRPQPVVLSVGELDRRLKRLLEGHTADVNVEGEISGLKEVASGHAYFTLKDEREEASIDCVMYRTAPPRARRLLKDGARVVVVGRATVYAPRGRLQLIADTARPAGRGALLEALERLKEKLAGEGLFAPEKKRALPAEPRVIGVVTSADGAALHDIVTVAFRRGPVRILLARAPVQGPDAPDKLRRALALLARVPEVEAIILGRGGGSADDLAAFNDEALVRAVTACRVPVVSAVGHEIDVSLTDLAADARAATPSQAAELLVPDARARADAIAHLRARMARAVAQRVDRERATLARQRALFFTLERTSDRLIGERRQALDDAKDRMTEALRKAVTGRRAEISRLQRRLLARHPRAVVAGARASLGPLEVRLAAAARRRVAALHAQLGDAAARLDALSPLAVLGRGYGIAIGPAGRSLVDAADVRPGDEVRVRLHRGAFRASVLSVEKPGDREDEG